MTFKADATKKKLFAKCNRIWTTRLFIPVIVLGLLYSDFLLVHLMSGMDYVLPIVLGTDVFLVLVLMLGVLMGTKAVERDFENYELTIEDTHAVLKTSMATTTVRFADIKRAKETEGAVTFYLGLLRRFHIEWETFENPTELKNLLDGVSARIGTFKKSDAPEAAKTRVRFSQKRTVVLCIVIFALGIIRILRHIL